jgi:hypothetical protein
MANDRRPPASAPTSPQDILTRSGYVVRKRPVATEPEDVPDQSIIRRWIVPSALIAIALAEWITEISGNHFLTTPQFLAYAFSGFIFSGISLTLGLLAMAKLMGAELDTLPAMVIKISATALLSTATASLIASIDHDPTSLRGAMVGLHVVLVLYFICLTYLFHLDLLDGLTAAVISLVIHAGLIMAVAQTLPPSAAKLLL